MESKMLYRFFDVNDVDDTIVSKYYLMMSDKRKAVISSMSSGHARAVALTGEMLARSLLCRLLDAPEFSFELLLNPNGRSAVGNYRAYLSLAACGDTVGCAVSRTPVGLCLAEKRGFSFAEAQSRFSDAELRYIFAESGLAFARLVNLPLITERAAATRFASCAAVKTAYNRARGRTAGESGVEILRDPSGAVLSDPAFAVAAAGEENGLCFAVVEKKGRILDHE